MSNGAFFGVYQPSIVVSGFSWLVTSGTYCHGIISRSAGGNGLRGESGQSWRRSACRRAPACSPRAWRAVAPGPRGMPSRRDVEQAAVVAIDDVGAGFGRALHVAENVRLAHRRGRGPRAPGPCNPPFPVPGGHQPGESGADDDHVRRSSRPGASSGRQGGAGDQPECSRNSRREMVIGGTSSKSQPAIRSLSDDRIFVACARRKWYAYFYGWGPGGRLTGLLARLAMDDAVQWRSDFDDHGASGQDREGIHPREVLPVFLVNCRNVAAGVHRDDR